jgi:hypothetical protein
MGWECFAECDVDGADEATSGKFLDPLAGTVITIANEYATLGFGGESVAVGVIHAKVDLATNVLRCER